MKAGSKQSNWLAKILDSMENRMEREDSKSIPVGSPQNKTSCTYTLALRHK
jgi:hypothetical protein